jgi:PAS domain S-box-containing protein
MEKSHQPHTVLIGKLYSWVLGTILVIGLYLVSLQNYLLFHTLAEGFSIIVAGSIFMLAWNGRRFLKNDYLLFIGIAYLFIASIDLLHTLAYEGMGVFSNIGINLAAQLWIAGRFMEACSLALAVLFINRFPSQILIIAGYTVVTTLLIISILVFENFPVCFQDGTGLTTFKVVSEYLIIFILLIALRLIYNRRETFDRKIFNLLLLSIILTVAAELAFTFYVSAFSFSNLAGHFLKIFSYYLIYKAIIEYGLFEPYSLLHQNFRQSEGMFRSLVESAQAIFWRFDMKTMKFTYMSPQSEELLGYPVESWTGLESWIDRLHPEDRESASSYCIACTGRGEDHTFEYRSLTQDGSTVWIRDVVTVITDENKNPIEMLGIMSG